MIKQMTKSITTLPSLAKKGVIITIKACSKDSDWNIESPSECFIEDGSELLPAHWRLINEGNDFKTYGIFINE